MPFGFRPRAGSSGKSGNKMRIRCEIEVHNNTKVDYQSRRYVLVLNENTLARHCTPCIIHDAFQCRNCVFPCRRIRLKMMWLYHTRTHQTTSLSPPFNRLCEFSFPFASDNNNWDKFAANVGPPQPMYLCLSWIKWLIPICWNDNGHSTGSNIVKTHAVHTRAKFSVEKNGVWNWKRTGKIKVDLKCRVNFSCLQWKNIEKQNLFFSTQTFSHESQLDSSQSNGHGSYILKNNWTGENERQQELLCSLRLDLV